MKKQRLLILAMVICLLACLFTACDTQGSDSDHVCEFGEWTVTQQATCTKQGQFERYCSCGEKQTSSISATGHSYAHVVTDPTCMEQGFTTHTCAGCGDSYVDTYVDALGHDEIEHIAQAPTCTKVGWDAYVTCSRCNYSTYNEISANGHTWVWIIDKYATTTESGLAHEECSACHTKQNENTAIEPIDCAHEGTLIRHAKVDATCTEDGTIEYWHCTACNRNYVDATGQIPVESLTISSKGGHSSTDWIIDKNATCTENGSKHKECSVCHVVLETEAIPATDHNYINNVCSNCGAGDSTTVHATNIVLNKTQATVNLGDSLNLVATIFPENATDKTVIWQSSNEAVAKVVNGAVSTLNIGTATITATTSNGMTAQCVVTVNGNAVIQYERSGGFYIVTGIEGKTDKLEIPFLYDGLRVRAIKAGAFEGNIDLKEVILPNSLEYIYANAFKDCSNLEKINLPESLTLIGESAFENCTSLNEITIPSLVQTISKKAFYNCTALKTVTICDDVKTIGVSTFAKCSALETATLGDGLETISDYAFDSCTSLKSFEMPNTVKHLGDFAFRYAESLESVTFSTSLTAIGIGCFQSCVSLDNIELHAGIVSFGDSCFSWCSGIKTLRILGDVTLLGNSSFYECTGLESVYYASSIAGDLGLNNYVFYNAGANGNGITFTLSANACIPDRLFEPQSDKNRPKLVKLVVESGAEKVEYFQEYNTLPYLEEIELPDTITYIKKGCFDNTAWWDNHANGAVYIGNIFYGYKDNLTGNFAISNNTVCIAMGALEGQNLTNLTIPFVGAIANGEENTHFGYIFGAEKAEEQKNYIPTTLASVLVKNCDLTITETAFDNCDFAVSLDHHWGEWTTTLNETCQSEGEEEKICSVCELVETRVRAIDPNAHRHSAVVTLPTCIEQGFTTHTCVCGDSYVDTYVDALGHTEGSVVVENNVEPDCTKDGSYDNVVYCTVCKAELSRETISVDALGHDEIEHIAQAPTCTEIGWGAYVTCSRCDYSTYNEISAIGHTSVTAVVTPPTCTEQGYTIHTCHCGDSYVDTYVDALGHTDVNTDGICDNCDEFTPEYLSKLTITLNDNGESYIISNVDTNLVGNITLPSEYQGKPVTAIGSSAFSGCSSLTSIVIPDSVTSIGAGAFSGCSSLESITIPFVGDRAGVTINDTYQYPFGYIFGTSFYTGGTAVKQFYYGSSTISTTSTTYYIPLSLCSVTVTGGNILYEAFYNCSMLTSITLGDDVTTIRSSAFYNCSSLTSITIPDSVTTIGSSAFYNCSSLTSIVIPDSVTTIGSSAFTGCSSLTSIAIPDSVTTIGDYVFHGCSSLTSITVDEGNTVYHSAGNCLIETETKTLIAGCKNSVIPTDGSVTTIGSYAFYKCSSLTSITIPDSVTTIGDYAFYNCYALVEVYNYSSLNITKGSSSYGYVASYALDVYTTNKPSKLTTDENGFVIHTNGAVKTLVRYLGLDTKITIPAGVTTIGNAAFYECSSLTSITIQEGVTTIGDRAFYCCDSLTSVTIGDSVTTIGSSAFFYCYNLTSIVIPDSVTTIGSSAFYNCSSLTSITIPDSVTTIGNYAFCDCTKLTSIVIPDSVTTIGVSAFEGCSSLTSVTFEDPKGWSVSQAFSSSSATNLTLTDASKNATYFTSTYVDYYWYKK